jgi:uncharacterized SAM-binding protein YcdF (DUF218 family)
VLEKVFPVLKKSSKYFCILIFLILLVDIIAFFFIPLEKIDKLLPFKELSASSTIAVLFHGYTGDRKAIDRETKRRINFGISLFRENDSDVLITSGGKRPQNQKTGAVLMAEFAVDAGVSDSSVHIEDASYDSKSNLENISRWISENKIKHDVMLISSPFHLMRIKALREICGTKIYYAPYILHEANPPISRVELWTSAHYNFVIYIINRILPIEFYDHFVGWLRKNTSF